MRTILVSVLVSTYSSGPPWATPVMPSCRLCSSGKWPWPHTARESSSFTAYAYTPPRSWSCTYLPLSLKLSSSSNPMKASPLTAYGAVKSASRSTLKLRLCCSAQNCGWLNL
uniref:Putative secreted protein n=1 Tax=Ixodes ricinus TaxID=34613 RepID=A0A6B0UJV6_IXORI